MEDKSPSVLKVALVQAAPVHNDVSASLEKAISLIDEAARGGAQLIAFGECWLSGYPAWIDHCPGVALWANPAVKKAYSSLLKNAISIKSIAFKKLADTAKRHQIGLVIGINEKVEKGPGNGTLYNSLLTIGPDGKLLNHHRKLMPTFNEKLLYGQGDGKGLSTSPIAGSAIGGLICWEHWMPLSRQALHNEGEEVHVAVWPSVNEKHQLASRHYAFEGRCYVLAVGQLMRAADIPDGLILPEPLSQNPEQLILNGGSCIISPEGDFLIEPQFGKEEIYFQTLDLSKIAEARLSLDTSGHYNRWDVFDFGVNRKRFQ